MASPSQVNSAATASTTVITDNPDSSASATRWSHTRIRQPRDYKIVDYSVTKGEATAAFKHAAAVISEESIITERHRHRAFASGSMATEGGTPLTTANTNFGDIMPRRATHMAFDESPRHSLVVTDSTTQVQRGQNVAYINATLTSQGGAALPPLIPGDRRNSARTRSFTVPGTTFQEDK